MKGPFVKKVSKVKKVLNVTHVNGVKCKSIDDVAEALNNTYEYD